MNRRTLWSSVLMASALLFSQVSLADDVIDQGVKELQHRWAVAHYQTPKDQREKAFEALATYAEKLSIDHPRQPELLVWQAIILSTYAGEKGGLSALSLVKQAKELLEQAELINPYVLQGSIYTSLGSLYYKVPGWPLGFGDDEKAEQYLKRALEVNPDGIDANYFYGDYLLEDGRYSEAVKVLEKAMNTPHRPGREIADAGRREEIQADLKKARGHL